METKQMQIISKWGEGDTQFALVGSKLIMSHPKWGSDLTIISYVPKSRQKRKILLQEIEDKAWKAHSKVHWHDLVGVQENFHSMWNKYNRKWEALATLIFGVNCYGEPDCGYSYGDLIA